MTVQPARFPPLRFGRLIAVWTLLVAALFAAGSGASLAAQDLRRVALVIGNAEYVHESALANPKNDATAVAAAFRRLGFQSVAAAANLTEEEMEDAFRAFRAEAESADVAVVFYAGHGIEIEGVNYLIPVDAQLNHADDAPFEAIPLASAMRAVGPARRLKVVIVDACRNNAFASRMRGAGGASRSVGRGLAAVDAPASTLIAYSARHGTVAADGSGLNSPYTQALLEELGRPPAEVRLLFGRVRDAVLEATGGAQEPFTYSTLGGTPHYFKAPENGAAEDSADFADWEGIKNSTDKRDYQSYLDRHPASPLAPLARQRLERLARDSELATLKVTPDRRPGYADEEMIVRAEPREGAAEIARLKRGDEVTLTGYVGGGAWIRVEVGGKTGYALSGAFTTAKPTIELTPLEMTRPKQVSWAKEALANFAYFALSDSEIQTELEKARTEGNYNGFSSAETSWFRVGLREYQQKVALPATGDLDPATIKSLMDDHVEYEAWVRRCLYGDGRQLPYLGPTARMSAVYAARLCMSPISSCYGTKTETEKCPYNCGQCLPYPRFMKELKPFTRW